MQYLTFSLINTFEKIPPSQDLTIFETYTLKKNLNREPICEFFRRLKIDERGTPV